MNQDEVDMIYDYLHENYEYRDGDLISKRTSRGRLSVGKAIGSFCHARSSGEPIINCSLTINKKRFSIQLKHLVYIYHHKIRPKNILLKDGNPVNARIENLQVEDKLGKFILQKKTYGNKLGATPYTYKGKTRYRVRLSANECRLTIGTYNDEVVAIKCYEYAKKLYMTKGISNEEIKKLSNEKYPENKHKKLELEGVSLSQNKKRYVAQYFKNGFRKGLGTYDTEKEAHEAYMKYKLSIETK